MRNCMILFTLGSLLLFACNGGGTRDIVRFKSLTVDEKLVYEISWKEGSSTEKVLAFYAVRDGEPEEKRLLAAWEEPSGFAQFVLKEKGAFFGVNNPDPQSWKSSLFYIDGVQGIAKRFGEIPNYFCSSEDGRYLVFEDVEKYEKSRFEEQYRIFLYSFPEMKEITTFTYINNTSYKALGVTYKRINDGNTIIVYFRDLDTIITRLEVNTKERSIREIGK